MDEATKSFVSAISLQLQEWRQLRKAGVGVRLLTLKAKSGRKFLIAAFALKNADISADGDKIFVGDANVEDLLMEAVK